MIWSESMKDLGAFFEEVFLQGGFALLHLASENNADPETLLLLCIPDQIPEFQAQLPDGPQHNLPSVSTLNSS